MLPAEFPGCLPESLSFLLTGSKQQLVFTLLPLCLNPYYLHPFFYTSTCLSQPIRFLCLFGFSPDLIRSKRCRNRSIWKAHIASQQIYFHNAVSIPPVDGHFVFIQLDVPHSIIQPKVIDPSFPFSRTSSMALSSHHRPPVCPGVRLSTATFTVTTFSRCI